MAGQPRADIVPVQHWQIAVEHDDVVGREPGLVHPGRAVTGYVDGDSLVTQALGDGPRHHLIVFNYQHAHASMVPGHA